MANQVASPMEFFGAAAYYIFNSTYVDCTFVATYLVTIPLTERTVG